jgi:hypothetical protein
LILKIWNFTFCSMPSLAGATPIDNTSLVKRANVFVCYFGFKSFPSLKNLAHVCKALLFNVNTQGVHWMAGIAPLNRDQSDSSYDIYQLISYPLVPNCWHSLRIPFLGWKMQEWPLRKLGTYRSNFVWQRVAIFWGRKWQ